MHSPITHSDIPCWYELSFSTPEKRPPLIALRLHKDLLAQYKPIPKNAPIVRGYMEQFGFSSFETDFNSDFGFNGSLKHNGERDGFIELLLEAPAIRQVGGSCEMCKGTGRDEFLERKCLYCNGSGQKISYNYHRAYPMCASFSLLAFLFGSVPEKNTASGVPQLLTLGTSCIAGMGGALVSGTYGRHVVEWLVAHAHQGAVPEMAKAMKLFWTATMGNSSLDELSFQARIDYENGWLNTVCPGNACGLHPSSDGIRKGCGYDFESHNVDQMGQQLCLLAGLAALHDLVRKEQNPET